MALNVYISEVTNYVHTSLYFIKIMSIYVFVPITYIASFSETVMYTSYNKFGIYGFKAHKIYIQETCAVSFFTVLVIVTVKKTIICI